MLEFYKNDDSPYKRQVLANIWENKIRKAEIEGTEKVTFWALTLVKVKPTC